jgi:hypothetical protein
MQPDKFDNKIRASLPNQSNYRSLGINKSSKFVYQDCKTELVRIISPEVSPWNKEWDILISFQKKKVTKLTTIPGLI